MEAGTAPGVVSVSCGSSHTVALLDGDCVVSFGRGEDGQLGHGDAENCAQPRAVAALKGQHISSVACGAEYSLAVSRERSQIYSWGWGDFGRLGHGQATDCFLPRPVAALSGLPIRQVACGDAHTLVITDDGALFTFGRNQNGQLGVGTTQDGHSPQRVEALKGTPVISVAAGAEHSVVATKEGRVFAFGWGRYGCLGDGSREDRHVPTLVNGLDGVVVAQVAAGWRHSIAVSDDSRLFTFGWGRFGQTGHGDTEDRLGAEEVAALKGVPIARVAGGWRHTAAVDGAGRCWTWGWNRFGQLGLGDTADRSLPARVGGGLEGVPIALVACGWRHTVVTTAGGALWSWGRGTNFQLGHGDEADRAEPAQVPEDALRAAVAEAGGAAALAPGGAPGGPAGRFAVVPGDGAAGAGDAAAGGAGGGAGGGASARKKARLAAADDEGDAAVPGG